MTAENGGGAFVIIYILSVILLALPIMAAEILIGKRGKQNPINSLRTLSNEASFYFKNQSDALLNRTTKAKKRFEDIDIFSYFIDAFPIRWTFSSLKNNIFSALPSNILSCLFELIKEGEPKSDITLLMLS